MLIDLIIFDIGLLAIVIVLAIGLLNEDTRRWQAQAAKLKAMNEMMGRVL